MGKETSWETRSEKQDNSWASHFQFELRSQLAPMENTKEVIVLHSRKDEHAYFCATISSIQRHPSEWWQENTWKLNLPTPVQIRKLLEIWGQSLRTAGFGEGVQQHIMPQTLPSMGTVFYSLEMDCKSMRSLGLTWRLVSLLVACYLLEDEISLP